MAKATDAPAPNHTLDPAYEVALRRVLAYLMDNHTLWEGEQADFEEADKVGQAYHIFSAFQAMHAWLNRGVLNLPLGRTVVTPGVLEQLDEVDVARAIRRHAVGDWGDMHREDWQQNDAAFEEGQRILSQHHDPAGKRFWVITESDRSVTTVLLPEEY